ncbi:MAG: AGE family epimerase/isomerase [Candidatus Omnitrophica bacterium]|nr:AGE family epimerase/isomerase [Candidatus Omnitrophota bacterium]
MKKITRYIFFLSLLIVAASFNPAAASEDDYIQGVAGGILALSDPQTKLAPSHWGHPGYEKVAFLYDKSVDALVLKAAGRDKEAEEIMDYFAARLAIPMNELKERADSNGVYGILKIYRSKNGTIREEKALINALDITSSRRQGKSELEFWTTPGPISFVIFAMLAVNPQKYHDQALGLGEVLLAMQAADGGVTDGDRAWQKVHTEPHMDAYAAFLMFYQLTGDAKWKAAAERAFDWFKENVYHPWQGTIDQGVWFGQPSTIFATDVYSWTMCGPAGERFSAGELKNLTRTMLGRSLVKVRLALPDRREESFILCDFSDALDERVKEVRNGFRPVGSVEWTAGVALALQKNAVRFFKAGDKDSAVFYKALAETLLKEALNCFYENSRINSKVAFYATGQGVEVGPFGSIEKVLASGWKTPIFFAKDKEGRITIQGGSTVSTWVVLPLSGANPFVLEDTYRSFYDQIPLGRQDFSKARDYLEELAGKRSFTEEIPFETIADDSPILEPEIFNRKMWEAMDLAYAAKSRKDLSAAKRYFQEAVKWSEKITDNPTWVWLAKQENSRKNSRYKGLISYPWGVTFPDNNDALHYAILHYPLLNEVGAAMWAQAIANLELGNRVLAKYWIRRIVTEIPLHQIPDATKCDDCAAPLIRGYWNALVSWEDNPAGLERDAEIGVLYREILREKGLNSAKPQSVLPQHSSD